MERDTSTLTQSRLGIKSQKKCLQLITTHPGYDVLATVFGSDAWDHIAYRLCAVSSHATTPSTRPAGLEQIPIRSWIDTSGLPKIQIIAFVTRTLGSYKLIEKQGREVIFFGP